MEIKRIELYKYNNTNFSRLLDVKSEVEGSIGIIIDRIDVTLTPKQKLNILTELIKSKPELVKLLQVEIDTAPDTLQGDMKNILDIDC